MKISDESTTERHFAPFRKRWLTKPKKKTNLDFMGNSTLLLINILFNSRRNEHKFVNIYLSIF